MLRNSVINIMLKVGLSLSLLYTALASLVVPAKVISRWPTFITHRVDESTLASFTGIVCFAIIIWLFFGKQKFRASVAALAGITLAGVFNILSVSFLFVLAPLFFIAVALCLRYYPRVRIVSETFVTPLHEGHLHGERGSDIVDIEKKEYLKEHPPTHYHNKHDSNFSDSTN